MADLGDTLNFRADLFDKPLEQGGVYANALAATLTITLPDGTTATPTVANPPATTGKYLVDYVTSPTGPQGRYVGQWLFTMFGGKTSSYVESFDVGASLVSVDEAQAHLRSVGIVTSAADLEQLQWLTLVASDAVERDLGRVMMRRTIIETYDGNGSAIRLRQYPIISVTTVVESGVTLASSGAYVLNTANGLLYRGSTTSDAWWVSGRQNIVVTYVAGYVDPPRSVRQVALGTVQELWQSSQQAAHPLINEDAELSVASAVSALPGPLRGAYNKLKILGSA